MSDVLRALALVRAGRLLDLSQVISRDTPHASDIRPPVRFLASGLPVAPEGVTVVNDYVTLCTHFATHVDAPGHIAHDGAFVNGGGPGEISLRGLRQLGAESLMPTLVPARLLDLVDEPELPLGAGAVEARVAGIEAGDALLVRVREARPAFTADAADWLARTGISVLGSNQSIDDAELTLHVRFVAHSEVVLLEGLLLDELASAIDGEAFALFVGPVRVARASGAWVSAVAAL